MVRGSFTWRNGGWFQMKEQTNQSGLGRRLSLVRVYLHEEMVSEKKKSGLEREIVSQQVPTVQSNMS